MPPDEVRAALIVATNEYEDDGLRQLRSPSHDAHALARVLGEESIGNFEVKEVIDEPHWVVMREVETFLLDKKRGRDDLLLLYFSCHGLKDDAGKLHFAASNTRRTLLGSTAIAGDWVNERIDRARSNRVVLILDCCYSGAFVRGFKGDTAVGATELFDGRGRVALMASNSLEYAFEGDEVTDMAQTSVFTGVLVEGLESGEADSGGDGFVDVHELYEYVYDKVREKRPGQTPTMAGHGVQGELRIARSRPKAAPLPRELREAMASQFPVVREAAVKILSDLLTGARSGLSLSAREVLQRMAEDDSKAVSRAAAAALGVAPGTPPTTAKNDPSPEPTDPGRDSEPGVDPPKEEPRDVPFEWAQRLTLAPLSLPDVGRNTGGALLVYLSSGGSFKYDGRREKYDAAAPDDKVIAENIKRWWQLGRLVEQWRAEGNWPKVMVGLSGSPRQRYVAGAVFVDGDGEWQNSGAAWEVPVVTTLGVDACDLRGRLVVGATFTNLKHGLFIWVDGDGIVRYHFSQRQSAGGTDRT